MNPTVQIETGILEGRSYKAGATGRQISSFRAIPYAAPPVGPLRFRAPLPPVPWSGVRDATEAGPSPIQSLRSPFSGVIPGNLVTSSSEDCLTLDVWAPSGPSNLPVLVWIPGGAFLTGGSALPTYDGSVLAADHDVVVVGVNYRLGVFGFAWLDDADTNCGLRDQIAALEWVQRNAAGFGGDPGNVTAFGESAGAGSLLHLLASTKKVKARRCILQSPGVDHTLRPDQAELVRETFLGHLPDRGAGLRDLPAEVLLEAQERAVMELMPIVSSMPFHPFVDGQLLPATPSVAFADGAAGDIDLLVSWTSDEMRLYPNPAADDVGIKGITKWTRNFIGGRLGNDADEERAERLVGFYQDWLAPIGRATPAEVWLSILTDGSMRLPARRIAESHAASGGTTRTVEFDWSGPPAAGEWDRRAFHAIDLPFTFGTLDRAGWREFLRAGPDADQLAATHMAAWAGFARSGAPEVDGVGAWPAYRPPDRPTVIFDSQCRLEDDPLAPIEAAWDGLWSPECRAPTLGA
jgi:para-nitrobenzyl esterase